MNRPKRRAGKDPPQQSEKQTKRSASNSARVGANTHAEPVKSESEFDLEAFFSTLAPIPASVPRTKRLTTPELRRLELVLEFNEKDGWRDDWTGNLDFLEKDIANPSSRGSKSKNGPLQPFSRWVEQQQHDLVPLARLLVRHVSTMPNIPPSAKKILGSLTDKSSYKEIMEKVTRVTHDPQVLREDGWTLQKSSKPVGASGGPYLIGECVLHEGQVAVIISYVHDADIGDLWRAMRVEDNTTFDMELEEVMDAKRKYSRRYEANGERTKRLPAAPGSKVNLSLEGIKYGIVMAGSYSKGARQGVYWPARVMHASEYADNSQSKRSVRQKLDLVFLAPYWKPDDVTSRGARKVEGLSDTANGFEATPLFQAETIDATEEMIKAFHIQDESGLLDYQHIQTSFRFTGLPGSYFVRYLDAYRLAAALRLYAKNLVSPKYEDEAAANLFGTHPLSVQTAKFPAVVLSLPYFHILSQLRRNFSRSSIGGLSTDSHPSSESIIQIGRILEAMKPIDPENEQQVGMNSNEIVTQPIAPRAHCYDWTHEVANMNPAVHEHREAVSYLLSGFMSTFPALNMALNEKQTPALNGMINGFTTILIDLAKEDQISEIDRSRRTIEDQRARLRDLVRSWISVKNVGEDCLSLSRPLSSQVMLEWRKACRRIYNFISDLMTNRDIGKGISSVVTDWRCNGHLTADGCFERAVRLPAAMKGVRQAISEDEKAARIIQEIPDDYIAFVEDHLLSKIHDPTYLERMKQRCLRASNDDETMMLTEDSEGEGGEDTMGSKGTWSAAVCGVASAVRAVDLVVNGECVNAFCATRPPGHHAGRRLHPMKAISNGFCILNPVAGAAMYAATPVSDGGMGLRRVCVVDFDAHHGNGTQDILCSTHDPRFLYISIHAGGSEVNGTDDDVIGNKSSGIYPGRCGDTSPHDGVLNIPLGITVTPHGVGTALLQKINPRVETFCPDLIIISAGFDAHKHDPMSLGILRAEDFYTITDSICTMARKHCNGRLISVLEGGYGVPCCRPQRNLFLPASEDDSMGQEDHSSHGKQPKAERKQPSALIDLGKDLPDTMDDQVPYQLQQRLEKCHGEGFVECVKEHVRALLKNNLPT